MAHRRLGQPLRIRRPALQRHNLLHPVSQSSTSFCWCAQQGPVQHLPEGQEPGAICCATVYYSLYDHAVGYWAVCSKSHFVSPLARLELEIGQDWVWYGWLSWDLIGGWGLEKICVGLLNRQLISHTETSISTPSPDVPSSVSRRSKRCKPYWALSDLSGGRGSREEEMGAIWWGLRIGIEASADQTMEKEDLWPSISLDSTDCYPSPLRTL